MSSEEEVENIEVEIEEPMATLNKPKDKQSRVDQGSSKKPRKKKELTEEQKQKLRDQLKKGREKALENRRKNALVKKIQKKEKDEERDEIIATKILKKKKNNEELEEMKNEIAELKKLLQAKQVRPEVIQKKPEPVPKPEPEPKEPEPVHNMASLKEQVIKTEILDDGTKLKYPIETPNIEPSKPMIVFSTKKKRNDFF